MRRLRSVPFFLLAATALVYVTGAGATSVNPGEDQLSASGGTAPYAFAVTSGVLPAGVTLDSSGYLSGVPASAGSFTFTVRVTDAHSSTGSRTYTLDINLQTLNVDPSTLQDATAGAAYTAQLTGVGGAPPYTFSLANGTSLPPGLVLSANGALTGTPSLGGVFAFGVTVKDATAATMSRAYVLDVTLVPLTLGGSLGSGTYGMPYDKFLAASGGTAPYTFSLLGGSLPPGLTFSTAGELSGTPTTWGSFSFMIGASDKFGDTGVFPFALDIAGPQILLMPDDLFAATSGLFYSATMSATGGIGTYTYTIASGTLPVGLTLASDGTLSGIPAQTPGLFSFTVKATDSNLATGTKKMTIMLATPLILVDNFALPAATVGVGYHQTLAVNGGTAPYTYSLVDGILPTGLVLSTDGTLSGSARTPGTSIFTVLIVDANGVRGQQSFRLVVVKSSPTVVKKAPSKKADSKPAKKNKTKTKAKPKKH